MKIIRRGGRVKPGIDLRSQAYPLSSAKTYLGRLIDKASRGEVVYIVAKQGRFVLQPVPEIEPIPARPPGFFAQVYTRAEIEQDNTLAKASVVKAPSDLE